MIMRKLFNCMLKLKSTKCDVNMARKMELMSSNFSTLHHLTKPSPNHFICFLLHFLSLKILLKLQVIEQMLLWLVEERKTFHAQLMEIRNQTSNGTRVVKQVETYCAVNPFSC